MKFFEQSDESVLVTDEAEHKIAVLIPPDPIKVLSSWNVEFLHSNHVIHSTGRSISSLRPVLYALINHPKPYGTNDVVFYEGPPEHLVMVENDVEMGALEGEPGQWVVTGHGPGGSWSQHQSFEKLADALDNFMPTLP